MLVISVGEAENNLAEGKRRLFFGASSINFRTREALKTRGRIDADMRLHSEMPVAFPDRAASLFLVDGGAAISVASTMVPSRIISPCPEHILASLQLLRVHPFGRLSNIKPLGPLPLKTAESLSDEWYTDARDEKTAAMQLEGY